MNTEKSSEAVRAARKELHDKVRNDWDSVLARIIPVIPETYLPYQWRPQVVEPQNHQSARRDDRKRYPFRTVGREDQNNLDDGPYSASAALDTAGGDAVDWRERTYAPSDPSSGEESVSSSNPMEGILNKLGIGQIVGRTSSEHTRTLDSNNLHHNEDSEAQESEHYAGDLDGYSGDTEDDEDLESLGREERKKVLRTKRRRRRQADEMKWNPGLRYWEMRRDIWCCAKPRSQLSTSAAASAADLKPSSTSEAPDPHDDPKISGQIYYTDHSNTPNAQPLPKPTRHIPSMILPVAPCLVSSNPNTNTPINPATYPAIYTKLVTQSLSPSLPLNLSVVVPSLVEGWKASGEWPSGTPSDPLLTVDLTSGTADKRNSNANGLSAIADATKNGLRALGGKTSTNGTSRKLDPKPGLASRGKRWLRSSQDLGDQTQHDAQPQLPSHQPQGVPQRDSKSVPGPDQGRNSSTSTPDSHIQQVGSGAAVAKQDSRVDQDATATAESPAPGSGRTGSTSGSTNELSSPRRVRKSVARMGKALKDGFTVSPTSADGVGS